MLSWQEAGERDINIITEKVAFDSVTRFEDQQRLPLGISINAMSYGACMLTQAAFEPQARPPYECRTLVSEA